MTGTPEDQLPPASVAAQRTGVARRGAARPYPPPEPGTDPEALAARLAATEALLTAETPEGVAQVVRTLISDLGGAVVPARLASERTSLPLDVSLGLGEPLLPFVDDLSMARLRVTEVLPVFLEHAKQVAGRLGGSHTRPEQS